LQGIYVRRVGERILDFAIDWICLLRLGRQGEQAREENEREAESSACGDEIYDYGMTKQLGKHPRPAQAYNE